MKSPVSNKAYDTVQYTAAAQTDSEKNGGERIGFGNANNETLQPLTSEPKYLLNQGPQTSYNSQRPPDKSKRTCCQKWALYSCMVGFVFIVASVICALLMKSVVEDKILENLPIRDGSEVYKGWKEPPVTPVVSFRIFNLTNHDSFINGLDKPNLIEVGPYAYRQKMVKTDISFSSAEPSVSYKVAKEYFFAPEMSCLHCSEDDIIIVPNIPLFGAFQKFEKEGAYTKAAVRGMVESYDFALDTKPFLKVTLRQFLWGYPSILASLARTEKLNCSSLRSESDGWDDFNTDWSDNVKSGTKKQVQQKPKERDPCEIEADNMSPFGLFVGRNGTGMDIRTVNTGASKIEERGLMIAWHNLRELKYWSKQECNKLQGRDPSSLPLNVQPSDSLEVFIGQLCRTIMFKYVSEGKVGNEFQTFRFTPYENSFDSPEDNPDNECYCLKKPCLPSGILDIRGCQQFSPIFMSWPHFLYADPDLKKAVHGIHPNQSEHSFILDVAPKYGIALRALARLQMNVIIKKDSGFGFFDKISQDQIVYPFIWLEDGVMGPSEVVAMKIRFLLNLPNNIQNLVAMVGLAFGLLLLVPEIVFWSRSCCVSKSKKEIAIDN